MTLPVSSYEELLVQVREITHETILLQRQLSSDLYDNADPTDVNHNLALMRQNYENGKLLMDNATRNQVKSRGFDEKPSSLFNQEFHTRLCQGLTVGDQIQSGELTARLLAWRNHNHHRRTDPDSEEESKESSAQPSKEKILLSGDAVVGRVGVESGLARDLWESQSKSQGRPAVKTALDREEPAYASVPVEVGASASAVDGTRACCFNVRRVDCLESGISSRVAEPSKENAMEGARKEEGEPVSLSPERLYMRMDKRYENDGSSDDDSGSGSSLQNQRLASLYHEAWPVKPDVWTTSRAGTFSSQQSAPTTLHNDITSAMNNSTLGPGFGIQRHRRLDAKMDVVYSLLRMLGYTTGREDMSATLLSMSNSVENCLVMRESGCLPLLVQLIHAPGQDTEKRERAARALHNVVHARSEDKSKRREVRVLKLLEQLRDYCQSLRLSLKTGQPPDDLERHPGATITSLMKFSFDEDHRHAMCQLGGLHAVAELIEIDHAAHGSDCEDPNCITLRRYAGMALTNLTFGDGNNKALLCSFREFMKALVSQLKSPSDDLRQVTASVLRNLSWRADSSSKQTLREVGAVVGLMKAAMEGRKESTLKSILSALWNLSAHCSTNKVDICAVEGALAFLVDMLSYKAPSKTLAIVENAGGILRNVSSHIAVREDYRAIVRERGCLQVLLRQLRSPSLTVVSNACGALWNLSARCPRDQRLLWDLGAVPMLRSLVHSKHKMISMGSSAALKNLLSARPNGNNLIHLDSTARGLGLPTLPTLEARRQRALEQEIDQSLSETCDNIEPSTSPVNKEDNKFTFKLDQSFIDIANARVTHNFQQLPGPSSSRYHSVARSESRESMRSVTSTHSDTIFEKVNRHALNGRLAPEVQTKQQSSSLHSAVGFDMGMPIDGLSKGGHAEKKYALRYKNAAVESNLRCTTSTISWTTGPDLEPGCSQILLRSPVDKKSIDYQKAGATKAKSDCFRNTLSPTLNRSRNSNIFGDYAETDLDQPTDYSLRYSEHVLDEDEKQSSAYFTCSDQDLMHEDTVKTYCTEGTPCQTSLNSSRAASASDLQEDIRVKSLQRKIMEINVTKDNTTRERNNGPTLQNCSDEEQRYDEWPIQSDSEVTTVSETSKINNPDITVDIKSTNDHVQHGTTLDMEPECISSADNFNSIIVEDEPKIIHDTEDKESNKTIRNNTGTGNVSGDQLSDADDDDEDLLACIHVGMQNNRHRQSFRSNSFEEDSQLEKNLTRYQTSIALNQVDGFPESRNDIVNSEVDHEQSTVSVELENTSYDNSDRTYSTTPNYLSLEDKDLHSEVIDTETDAMFSAKAVTNDVDLNLEQTCNPEISTSDSYESFVTIQQSENKDSLQIVDQILEAVEMATEKREVQEEEYRRQRDPDAMIASLDRLTATLVQQTEAMRERDSSTMKQSLISDIWNEDSPNDVSFPTISVSAPLVASFKSDAQDDREESMTNSRMIELEARKLAEAVSAEMNKQSYIDLDNIKPPSSMGSLLSLTTSTGPTPEITENERRGDSTSLPASRLPKVAIPVSTRKKSLPIGMIAKRALSNVQNCHTGSLENLLNECNHSQLENMKPPSMMDDLLLDANDMENSMVSVASITSEVADSKENDSNSLTGSDPVFDLVKPVANVLAFSCMRYAESMHHSGNNSFGECLENINPPSLFNEVNEFDESVMDMQNDRTLCNDTLCIDTDIHTEENVHPIVADHIEEIDNDTDEGATPIPTEYCASSSAESTPKKKFYKNSNHLTPKQKRQQAKERYKTYTIAAGLVKKEEEIRRKQEQEEAAKNASEKYSQFSKLTPKQRRQEDRARFQTQVLGNQILDTVCMTGEKESNDTQNSKPTTNVRSSIPTLKKFAPNKTFKKSTTTDNVESGIVLIHDTVEEAESKNNAEETVMYQESCEQNPQMHFTNGQVRTQKSDIVQVPSFETTTKVKEDEAEEVESVENFHSDGDESVDSGVEEKQVKGPRIIKPGTLTRHLSVESNSGERNDSETPKTVRGRRKPLYSSPTTRKSTPQSSPMKQALKPVSGIPIGRSNTSPIVRSTRATTLRQNNSLQKSNTSPKMSPTSTNVERRSNSAAYTPKRNSAIQKGSASTSPLTKYPKRHSVPPGNTANLQTTSTTSSTIPRPLERQGTFTKDEPEVDNAPTVLPSIGSPNRSKIAKPTKNTAKVHPSSPSKTKVAPKNCRGPAQPKNAFVKRPPQKNSQTILTTCEKKTSVTSEQCSTSNSSIASTTQASNQGRKLVKETTSKIAILWKKAEESRMRQRMEKDTRQWVMPNGTDTTNDETPTLRLFRSSTFEDISQKDDVIETTNKVDLQGTAKLTNDRDRGVSYVNSGDISGMGDKPCKIPIKFSRVSENGDTIPKQNSEDAAKRVSRLGSFFRVESEEETESGGRAPASAIVAPFNYHPDGTVNHGTKDRKSGDVEGKAVSEIMTGSAKVTTV